MLRPLNIGQDEVEQEPFTIFLAVFKARKSMKPSTCELILDHIYNRKHRHFGTVRVAACLL